VSARATHFYDLGALLRDAPPPSNVQVTARIRLERRAAERLVVARRVVLATREPSIVDVVRANAKAVTASLSTIDRHFQRSGRSNVDWPKAAFDLNLIVTNWLTTWRLYRDHSVGPYRKGTRPRTTIEAAQHAEFDGHFAYRLTEQLRDFVTHVDLPPTDLALHEKLDAAGNIVRSRTAAFDPAELLERWGGWKSIVKADLRAASKPVSLDDLIPTGMQSLERIEVVVAAVRQPAERRAARSVLRAADRVANLAGLPCLFEVKVGHAEEPLVFSPMPLPVDQAHYLLQ
jgi:hypothetical protein